MQRFLVAFLAVIGFLSLVFFLGGLVLLAFVMTRSGEPPKVAAQTILEIDFEVPVLEDTPPDPFARLLQEDQLILRELVEAIDRAAEDEHVVALVGQVGGVGLGFAQVQEVRDAITRFRTSGKPTVAFAESFGEFSPGNAAYYLASAFDRIYLQPSGDLTLIGLYYEHPFVRGTLDKIGAVPRIEQRYEYKNAANLYKETEFTPAHREAATQMIESLDGQIVQGIADSRGLSVPELRTLIDRAPLAAADAMQGKLIDDLLYRDQLDTQLEEDLGEDTEFLDIVDYIERTNAPGSGRSTIALVYGYGAVMRGESGGNGFQSEPTMGSDTVTRALREATDDDDVAAIVFRVSSPGGSYIASDAIFRETLRAKEAGKPLVVSMGDYAASGGYFVSMAADHIVAQPGTLTGSIGVFGGKVVLGGTMEKIGVSFDEISTGQNASMFSPNRDYSESEFAALTAWLDRVYGDFTGKVAVSRNLQLERVQEIAKGRVWTGQDALGIGLVDELGGLSTAVQRAVELAEIDSTKGYRLRVFPAEKSTWELLLEHRAFRTGLLQVFKGLGILENLRPLLRTAEELHPASRGALTAPHLPPAERTAP